MMGDGFLLSENQENLLQALAASLVMRKVSWA